MAAVTDDGVEPVGQGADEVGDTGVLAGGPYLVIRRVGPRVAQVGQDGVVEHVSVLCHDSDRVVHRFLGGVAQVLTLDQDLSGLGVVQPRHQRRDGGLARARGSDERDHLTGRHGE